MHLLNDEDGNFNDRELYSKSPINNVNNTFNQPYNINQQNNLNYQNQNQNFQNNNFYIQRENLSNNEKPLDYYQESLSNYEYNNIKIKHNKVEVNKGLLLFVFIILGYISFVIIGCCETSFTKNTEGKTVAVVANLKDRKNREDFYKVKGHYEKLLSLIESSDDYEYQMEHQTTPFFTLSTYYSDNLVAIDKYMAQIKAIEINPKYESLKIEVFETYNIIALYSQKMNDALLNDNLNSYKEAMAFKEKAELSIENIRKNLITFGELEAKIFNDKTLLSSRVSNATNNIDLNNDITPTPDVQTGNYGEDTLKPTATPTPMENNQELGGGRLDSNTTNNKTEKEKDNGEIDTKDNQNIREDDNISLDNPYS